MAEGRKAADETKGVLKGIGNATEGLRNNINSFADELAGDKSHANARAQGTHPDSTTHHGVTGTHSDPTTTHGTTGVHTGATTTAHGPSSGIHPDAKKTGDKLAEGVGAVAGKVERAADGNKRTTY
ncbi:hypothetical protein LTR09_010847 [Extremus antarcticus]|uniref:Uncharacterized protein n=1 Tax=Extremus antarcticus TaxID=702011 RepID=A0AAJ0D6V7_9PEZI|nr:hypothetical protein LTR09_010847 [Extremus antarcticus]